MKLLLIPEITSADRVPREVFADLQMPCILSERALAILQYPCRADEILARQTLFATIREPQARETALLFRDRLLDLERARLCLREAKSEAERAFLQVGLLKALDAALQVLPSLALLGKRFASVASHWWGMLSDWQDTLAEDLKQASAALAALSRFTVVYMTDKIQLTSDVSSRSYDGQITDAARKLGLDLPAPRMRQIRVRTALSSGIEEQFAPQFAELRAIFERYRALPLDELLSDRPAFDFLFEIDALCQKAEARSIPVSLPTVSRERRYAARELYDVSLFAKDCTAIVPNDSFFEANEGFFLLTGANGGGKTSYLRAVGLNLLLFLGGCPIFARHAEIYPFSGIRTHFPVDERFTNTGRLDEERTRMEQLLAHTDENVFFLLNETFSGADEVRGRTLATETAHTLTKRGSFGLFVTHFHEMQDVGLPMLTTVVDKENANVRTYRITRRQGDGSSFASDILKKYALDRDSLRERRCAHEG